MNSASCIASIVQAFRWEGVGIGFTQLARGTFVFFFDLGMPVGELTLRHTLGFRCATYEEAQALAVEVLALAAIYTGRSLVAGERCP